MKIGPFALVRLLVMLRKIHRSLEGLREVEQASLAVEQRRLELDHPNWKKTGSKPQKLAISSVDIGKLNENWRRANGIQEGQ